MNVTDRSTRTTAQRVRFWRWWVAATTIGLGVKGTWLRVPSGSTVRLCDVATGVAVRAFPGQGMETIRVVFSPDGALLR